MSKLNRKYILFFILFTAPILGAGVDIFSPALPIVAHQFGTSLVSLAIGVYVIFYGGMQIFVGPFADAFGHRKLLFIGMFCYVLVSIAAGFADSITSLLILRALQGTTIAIVSVVIRAMVGEIYEHKEIPIVMNYFTMAWSVGPVIAPFIGGYLTHFISWHATLYFLAIYVLMAFLIYLKVPETRVNTHPLQVIESFKAYGKMLKNSTFMGAVVCMCLCYGIILNFNVVGPFLLQDRLGYSAIGFGHVALFLGLGNLIGGFCNRFILKKYGPRMSMDIVIVIGLVSAIAMLSIALMHIMNLYVIVIPTFFFCVCTGMVFGTLFGLGLQLFKGVSGKVGGLSGTLVVTGGGTISAFATLLKSQNQIALSISNIVLVCIIVIAYWFLIRPFYVKCKAK